MGFFNPPCSKKGFGFLILRVFYQGSITQGPVPVFTRPSTWQFFIVHRCTKNPLTTHIVYRFYQVHRGFLYPMVFGHIKPGNLFRCTTQCIYSNIYAVVGFLIQYICSNTSSFRGKKLAKNKWQFIGTMLFKDTIGVLWCVKTNPLKVQSTKQFVAGL